MSNKTYILLKDLPNVKAGVEVTWNSTETWTSKHEGGRYGIWDMPSEYSQTQCWTCEDVENNPEWFKLKEEQPKEGQDAFVWNEDLIDEYAVFYFVNRGDSCEPIDKDLMSVFKASKYTGKIEVMDFHYDSTNSIEYWYNVATNKAIPPEKYESIKQVIERVLNPLTKVYQTKDGGTTKLFTEKELLEAEEKAFTAGRSGTPRYDQVQYTFTTFSDYKNNYK